METFGSICREELGWDERRWGEEEEHYTSLVDSCYSLPRESFEHAPSPSGLSEGGESPLAARN
jgi:hypothetical protein